MTQCPRWAGGGGRPPALTFRLAAASAAPLCWWGHPPHLLLHHPWGPAVGLARGRAPQPALRGTRPLSSAL